MCIRDRILTNALTSNAPLSEKEDFVIQKLHETQGSSERVLSQEQVFAQQLLKIKEAKKSGLLTGVKSFDRLLDGGFKKTELGFLAGGAGSGKTALALQLADGVAQNGGIVLYLSVEVGTHKLTHRSLKRLHYKKTKSALKNDFDIATAEYQSFCKNIYLVKGHHGMLASQIRSTILNIMRLNPGKDVLIVIDPFQRLGSGDQRVDRDETAKIGLLASQLKDMAEKLNIPILALSDTVKNHNDPTLNETQIRGGYMANHMGDYTIQIKTSRELSLVMEKYMSEDESSSSSRQKPKKEKPPYYEYIKSKLNQPSLFKVDIGTYALNSEWDKYAVLQTSKVRENGAFDPLFVYHPEHHYFEDVELFEEILPEKEG